MFLPVFVVIGLLLFRKVFSAERRAAYSRAGQWLSALFSWFVTTLMWSILAYLVVLLVIFLVLRFDLAAFWSSPG